MTQSLSYLIQRLKPYWLQAGGAAFGWEINKIIYLPIAGAAVTYDKTAANLTIALAGMAAGEIVQIHGPCTLADDFTIPADTCLMGIGPEIELQGTITLGDGSIVYNLDIAAAANDANALYGVSGPTTGTAYLFDCKVTATQSGAGSAYAVGCVNGAYYGAGNVHVYRCRLNGVSVGGSGYAARSTYGEFKMWHGSAYGSTARWVTA